MATSSRLLRSNSSPCRDELQEKDSFQLSEQFLPTTTKTPDYNFEDKQIINRVLSSSNNDDVKQMKDTKEKMELSPKSAETLKVNNNSNSNINDGVIIEGAASKDQLATKHEKKNGNESFTTSSSVGVPSVANNVNDLSRLSGSLSDNSMVSHCLT